MCFEDRPITADYDMNDVVLKCNRINNTTVKLSLVATGANDEVYLDGIEGSTVLNGKEVHALFGVTKDEKGNRFVNTVNGVAKKPAIEETITIGEGVSIPQFLKKIFIRNESSPSGREIRYPEGNTVYPRAIIVPINFRYPNEGSRITKAYKEFISWARDINIAGNWYRFEQEAYLFHEFLGSDE